MKYISIALVCMTLTACTIEEGQDVTELTTSVCLDGVEYWTMYLGANAGVLAPRVDPETLTFVRCAEKEK